MTEELLPAVTANLQSAIMVVDEVSPKQTARIKQIVRQKVNPRRPSKANPKRIKKIRGERSGSDDLLQLAQVIAWAIFRLKERGDRRYFEVIEPAIAWCRFSGEK